MKKLAFAALAALALTALSTRDASAQAAQNYWSQSGAQCVVDDNAQANALYSRTSGSIKFAAGKTGTIGLFCAINKNNGAQNPNQIWINYQDTDGSGVTSTFVLARLFGMPRFSLPTNIFQIGTDVTSLTPAGPPFSLDNRAGKFFTHTLDFENNYYFIYAEITRASTAQQAILYGVALSYNQ
jgi:hypothetical protein